MTTYKRHYYHGKIKSVSSGKKEETLDEVDFQFELAKLISKFINKKGLKAAAYATIHIDIVHYK